MGGFSRLRTFVFVLIVYSQAVLTMRIGWGWGSVNGPRIKPRCCCEKTDRAWCINLTHELVTSKNPFLFGQKVCPTNLGKGFRHWKRLGFTSKPASCKED